MSMTDPSQELVITSVSFADGTLEVTYLEKREQGDFVGLMKTIFLDTKKADLADQHQQLLELCVEIVDGALLALRNPPINLDPRKRFRGPKDEPDE